MKYRLIDRGLGRLTQDDPPEALTAPSLLAELLHAKFAIGTPFDRLFKDVARRTGVRIANPTVSRWAQQFAALARPLTDLMRRRMIAHSRVIGHDDSPVRQLPAKKSGQRRCSITRFWSAVGERGSLGDYVVIAHTQGRGGSHVRAWLGDPADDDVPRALRFAAVRRVRRIRRAVQPAGSNAGARRLPRPRPPQVERPARVVLPTFCGRGAVG